MAASPYIDIAAALDPVVFAEACGIVPDAWQSNVLRSSASRILLNASRQSGKTTTAAVLALHQARFTPASLVLLVSPSLRQSMIVFGRIVAVHEASGGPAFMEQNASRATLPNGSQIISLPGTEATIRGYSNVALLLMDEASRIEDDLYLAVSPMVAVSGGHIIAMSTPNGARGWWHGAWTDPEQAWQRVQIDAYSVPRISRDFLDAERRAMGERWFAQEYLCAFTDVDAAAFRSEDIDALIDPDLTSWRF